MTGWLTSPPMTGGIAASWRVLWPGVSLGLAALLATAPGAKAFSVAAQVPVMVIFYWIIAGARGLPFALVFAVGLVLDAVSYVPFGGWALIYVAVALLAATVADFANVGAVHRSAMLFACLSLASLLQLILMLLFGAELPPVTDVAVAIGLAVVGNPFLVALLRAGTVRPSEPHLFDRAGYLL